MKSKELFFLLGAAILVLVLTVHKAKAVNAWCVGPTSVEVCVDMSGNLTVPGNSTITGNETVSGTQSVTGAATFKGALILPVATTAQLVLDKDALGATQYVNENSEGFPYNVCMSTGGTTAGSYVYIVVSTASSNGVAALNLPCIH